ncbi:hypothetical protein LOD99_2874 [Oopsacas minuta]|uniref:FERM domain-containing protein n=1 Tax=Oopsacas minuta TaxID=111878 RepID=A0AAV7JYR8_9METZ|nr:hypothetical protein LOD99_2874 [Oopsacas minuta]
MNHFVITDLEHIAIEEALKEIKYISNSLISTEANEDCEEEILTHYKLLIGMQKNDAISTYLELVQELPSYGMQFYNVKDTNEVPKLIGIGLCGITQFSIDNRNRPEQIYLWTGISKISSRDNKFILEFRNESLDLDRLLVDENVLNTGNQCHNILTVQSWYSDSHQLIRVMETMAATQLNFFEQRKKIRVGIRLYSSTSSTSSISSLSSITHSSSACTQKSDNSITSMEATQTARLASKEHYNTLKIKKEELERIIEDKEAELRRIKIEEAKLTGIVPDDLTEEERASLPKQMATSYTLQYLVESDLFNSVQKNSSIASTDPENDKELKRLTRVYEVQCNIVKAEYKIYKGDYSSKKIKKQRKKNYKASEKKLKELEKELEKRRDFLGISCRQSRFYSQVADKDDYNWEVIASKSFTMPLKYNPNVKLSAVDENRVTQHSSVMRPARHSSAVPIRIDPTMMQIRQNKHSASTTYNKKSNASDSYSTASPMEGNSFLSLYSRGSSSHISSTSVSSDEDRCLSCPVTEMILRKHNEKMRNEVIKKRASQHLDLAFPEKAIVQKKKETIDNLNLDITNHVIFKPPTRYPDPTNSKISFSAPKQSAKEFYAKSLPLDDREEREERNLTHSANFVKHQYSSDQISKQYEHKLAYTQQNSSTRFHRTPSPRTVLSNNTKYPLPYTRVNSVPYGLFSSKSPSHEKINNTELRNDVISHSQTHLTPNHSYTTNTVDRLAYSYGGNYTQSNGTTKSAVPITRIHTSPSNVTALEYSKPTHYPQSTSPKLNHKNMQARLSPKPDPRVVIPPNVPNQYQPYLRTQNPATNKYINPPLCRIQVTSPDSRQYSPIEPTRYKSPYNHQYHTQSISEERYRPTTLSNPSQTNTQYHPTNLTAISLHDPLSYSASVPVPSPLSQQPSPGVKCKIDYWENQTAANMRPTIHNSKSLDKIARKSYPDYIPVQEKNRQSMNISNVTSRSFRSSYNSDSNAAAFQQRDYTKGMPSNSDEGTPV